MISINPQQQTGDKHLIPTYGMKGKKTFPTIKINLRVNKQQTTAAHTVDIYSLNRSLQVFDSRMWKFDAATTESTKEKN